MLMGRLCSPKGFTLIEVLVALLIVGVGLLGIAALVLFSMRASFESGLQTYAALLATDVHETAWLSAHTVTVDPEAEDLACANIGALIDLGRFSPSTVIPGLNATVTGTYPVCVFRVTWGGDGSSFGVVGQMASFGGESGGTFIHQFVIPTVQ